MKTKILLILFCLTSLCAMGQGVITRNRCNTCGKTISQCTYHGNHPQKPEPKPEKSCNSCGRPISKCKYNGKHPIPEPTGYNVTFSCNISSAILYIDDKYIDGTKIDDKKAKKYRGSASGTYFLRTGPHKITVHASGYNLYSETIEVSRKKRYCNIILTKKSEPVTSNIINGHEWVDLGLSVKWATMNVGASSPSDYGGYYAWGEIRTKSSYECSNCFDCLDNKGESWGIYKLGGLTEITPSSGHDTARENWGGSWRMPTASEIEELCKKCKWTWTSKDGLNGYNVIGPNGNSIFLPAAGWCNGTSSYSLSKYGAYWSSTLDSSDSGYARYLFFKSNSHNTSFDVRCYGQRVRPVTE